jgi:hypothetical protein
MCERNMITQVEKLKAARPQVKGWVSEGFVVLLRLSDCS